MEFDIATLEKATRVDLLEHWRFLINRPPPKHISRSLLIQILAWEQQSAVYGGFTKKLSLSALPVQACATPCAPPSSLAAASYANITERPMLLKWMMMESLFGTCSASSHSHTCSARYYRL